MCIGRTDLYWLDNYGIDGNTLVCRKSVRRNCQWMAISILSSEITSKSTDAGSARLRLREAGPGSPISSMALDLNLTEEERSGLARCGSGQCLLKLIEHLKPICLPPIKKLNWAPIRARFGNIECVLDSERQAGRGYYDADLIGIPIRITVSARSLAKGGVEMKRRDQSATEIVAEDSLAVRLKQRSNCYWIRSCRRLWRFRFRGH